MATLPTAEQLTAVIEASSIEDAKNYFEVMLSVSKDRSEDVGSVLGSVRESLVKNSKISDTLVDCVWMQTSLQPEDQSGGEDLGAIVRAIATALPELHSSFLGSLDAPWLQVAGVVKAEADLNKKLRQTNTSLYYRQFKFNILSEVSEGYAKFLYFASQQAQSEGEDNISDRILSMIGTFSLDPSRCLDIAVDVLEDLLSGATTMPALDSDPRLVAIVSIIKTLCTNKITPIMAFKIKERKEKKSLLKCVVFLFCQKLLDLIDMIAFFPEWFEPLQDMIKEHRKKERGRIKAVGLVRLSSSSSTNEDVEEILDLDPIEHHLTTQLLMVFLEWNLFAEVEEIFKETWSDLCELFPLKIGSHICEWVEKETKKIFAGHVPAVKWVDEEEKSEGTQSMAIDPSSEEKTPTQVIARISTLLAYTTASGCIAYRPTLFVSLWRLVSHYLDKDQAVEECTSFVEEFLLPALGAFNSNGAISMEAWKAVSKFPCRKRYALYSKWRGTGLGRDALNSGKPLWLVEGEMLATKDSRYALKRLSKDTVRETSRAIAKISHGHPLVVFSIMLSTIESFDNMIKVMVESMRFVAPLSLDVLCFCILNRLTGSMGDASRSRLKEDGVNVSQWLQSLETFIGALCKQFPSLEVRGIISYLILRLRKGEVMELGVLRTILKTSGGWAFADHAQAASLSPVQLEGRAGSTLLKREIMSFGVYEDFSVRACAAMRKILQSDNFGTSFLILLAQVHHQIIFEGQGRAKPIKLIGNLVDSCQATMAILLDFLTDSAIERSATDETPPEAALTLANSMPSLLDLIQEFELDLSSVWMIGRPLIRAAASIKDDTKREKGTLAGFEIGEQVRKAYMAQLPEQTWNHITCDLYESFYCNTLFDIFLPDDSYKTEIARLEREIDSKTKAKNESDAKSLARMKKAMAELSSDWNKQRHHVEAMHNILKGKVDKLFPSENFTEAMSTFFTACIFPRCMKGPDDALYCAHFVSLLHSFETPGFGTLHLYDLMIVTLSRAIFGLTEAEAANVAILLESVWKSISQWRYDEDCFAEGIDGKPGSYVKNENSEDEAVTADTYAILYNKWHASFGAAMLGCLRSSEYMHSRNCLIVLSRMVETYPTRPTLANRLISALGPLQEESYPFADIRASAQAYNTQLIKARDEGVWKEETSAAKEARKAKEQAAAAARQKKSEELMEEIKKDSEKITEEIGERDSYDQRRPARGAPRRDQDDRRAVGSSGPPPPRDERDHGRPRRDAPLHIGPPGSRRDDGGRTPDDRWQRGGEVPRAGEGPRGSKRSRGPSPVDPGEVSREEGRASKRPRTDRTDSVEDGAIPDDSGGRRGRKSRRDRR
eukprot:scaffold11454_cov168-Amphora_coffeaeformis.AAC.22